MQQNEIIKTYGTNYKTMTRELLETAGLSEMIPSKDARIGIKPNLVAPIPASYGATTHPEIVAGIIEYLRASGFSQIVILESSWVGDKTSESLEVCGYSELLREYDVPFLDMQKDRARKIDAGGMELMICQEALALDFLINVPVLKGHCQTKVTCALKNMKGLIPNSEKRHFHAWGLHRPIAHLAAALHQDFILVDQICGDPDCEDGGNPYVTNCLMAARDPVLCDAYGASLLGYGADEIPYIIMAEELGVGSADLHKLCIRQIGHSQEEEKPAKRRRLVAIQDKVEEVDSCSACYANLVPVLLRLEEEGTLDQLGEKLAIGQGYRGKKGRLGIGNCTRCFEQYIPGCPPEIEEIDAFLREIIRKQAGSEGTDRGVQ
ncbi:MAG: DUF362 domain-containing protein [Lachnospiraceae bacterium]|nr:DUF362 domain-containing protein [Lachnospiraceae bacterium]